MVSAPVRRQQIAYVCQRGLSIRRACALLKVARSSWRYRSRLIERDAGGVQTEPFNNQPGPSHFLETTGPKNAGRSRGRARMERFQRSLQKALFGALSCADRCWRQWARAQRPGGSGVRGGIPVKGRAQDLVLILITRLQAAEGIRVSVKTTPRMK
jgi:hypothetical protein